MKRNRTGGQASRAARRGYPLRRDDPPGRHRSRLRVAPRTARRLALQGIPSQTKTGDRASLLALQEGVATVFGAFEYLEIGSHLGGSLQAAVRDPRVERIVSIDLRPEATPDERGKRIPYAGNSTQRMLDNLAALPGADLERS